MYLPEKFPTGQFFQGGNHFHFLPCDLELSSIEYPPAMTQENNNKN